MTAQQTPTSAGSRPFTGKHMLMVMLTFFGVIISVNMVMAISASATWTGLAVQNSYVASQEFNDKEEARRAQQLLGWRATLSYTPGAARFTIEDGAGNPVELGNVTLALSHPVGSHDDHVVKLSRSADGGYRAAIVLGSGVWNAVVTADPTTHGSYELHDRFKVE